MAFVVFLTEMLKETVNEGILRLRLQALMSNAKMLVKIPFENNYYRLEVGKLIGMMLNYECSIYTSPKHSIKIHLYYSLLNTQSV